MQICAVLAAVTEVIRSQGGKETETEYFAALVSGCDSVGVGVQSSRLCRREDGSPQHVGSEWLPRTHGSTSVILWWLGETGGICCVILVKQKSTTLDLIPLICEDD